MSTINALRVIGNLTTNGAWDILTYQCEGKDTAEIVAGDRTAVIARANNGTLSVVARDGIATWTQRIVNADALTSDVQAAILDLDKGQPVFEVYAEDEDGKRTYGPKRWNQWATVLDTANTIMGKCDSDVIVESECGTVCFPLTKADPLDDEERLIASIEAFLIMAQERHEAFEKRQSETKEFVAATQQAVKAGTPPPPVPETLKSKPAQEAKATPAATKSAPAPTLKAAPQPAAKVPPPAPKAASPGETKIAAHGDPRDGQHKLAGEVNGISFIVRHDKKNSWIVWDEAIKNDSAMREAFKAWVKATTGQPTIVWEKPNNTHGGGWCMYGMHVDALDVQAGVKKLYEPTEPTPAKTYNGKTDGAHTTPHEVDATQPAPAVVKATEVITNPEVVAIPSPKQRAELVRSGFDRLTLGQALINAGWVGIAALLSARPQ